MPTDSSMQKLMSKPVPKSLQLKIKAATDKLRAEYKAEKAKKLAQQTGSTDNPEPSQAQSTSED